MKSLLFVLFISANESLPAPEPLAIGVPSAYWPGPLTMQQCYEIAERMNTLHPIYEFRRGYKVLAVKYACVRSE